MEQEKVDLFELHKEEYRATGEPRVVETGPARYLVIEGIGEPAGEQFTARIEALFSVAYGIKMAKKKEGRDYKVAKLEGLWWGSRGPGDFSLQPKDEWNWKLIIRTPEFVSEDDLESIVANLLEKGKGHDIKRVKLETIDEGLCVQILHIGPYAEERASIEKLNRFAQEQGLSFHGLHHEIYLSDFRRVPPERLKTILRMPVC
jgi:hypothetical protein